MKVGKAISDLLANFVVRQLKINVFDYVLILFHWNLFTAGARQRLVNEKSLATNDTSALYHGNSFIYSSFNLPKCYMKRDASRNMIRQISL